MTKTNGKKLWDTDINRSRKDFIAAAENISHACRAMEEDVCQDFDLSHLCDAANGLMIEARDSDEKMLRAMKDYRLSKVGA